MFRFGGILLAGLLALLTLGAGGAGVPVVGTNAQLGNLPSYQAQAVLRLGVLAPGDAPAQWFMPSSAPCSIAGGDIGSQTPAADGGCFIAMFGPGPTDIREWGATLAADIMPYIVKAWQAQTGHCIYIPPGIWLVESSQFFNQAGKQALCIVGTPPTYNGTGAGVATAQTGTWMRWPAAYDTMGSPFRITSSSLQNQSTGPNVDHIAFEEDQPAPGSGAYTPDTNYVYWFNVSSLYGFRIGHVLFLNDTQCVSLVNGGRMDIDELRGQPLGTCIYASQLYDIPRWHDIDLWPYWTSNTNVYAYMLTVDPIVDSSGIWADFIFDIGYHSGFKSIQATDVPLGGHITELYGDGAGSYTFWNTAPGATWRIDSIQGASENNSQIPFLYQAGQNMIENDGNQARLSFGHVYVTALGGSIVNDTNSTPYNAVIEIDSVSFAGGGQRWNLANSGQYAFQTAANPASTPAAINVVRLSPGAASGGAPVGWANIANGGVFRLASVLQPWTPGLAFSGGGSVTCATCVGQFRWGTDNRLVFTFMIQLSALSSPAGNITITGAPYACDGASGQNANPGIITTTTGMTGSAVQPFTLLGGWGVTPISIYQAGVVNQTALTAASLTATTTWRGEMSCYSAYPN